MKIWEAMYNPMTYESCYGTISLHTTKKGARKAMIKHKLEKRKEYQEHWKWLRTQPVGHKYAFGDFEDWHYQEIIVNED